MIKDIQIKVEPQAPSPAPFKVEILKSKKLKEGKITETPKEQKKVTAKKRRNKYAMYPPEVKLAASKILGNNFQLSVSNNMISNTQARSSKSLPSHSRGGCKSAPSARREEAEKPSIQRWNRS